MKIHGLNKTTLLDYPGHLAATLFLGSCNFRCVFCQNTALVLDPASQPVISEEEIFSFIQKRKGVLQGICITGGEPTLDPDLIPFITRLKNTGLKIKLDTNGYRPEILKELLEQDLLDMVAMDIKSAPSDYPRITGLSSIDFKKIEESIHILMNSSIDYEFRTTVVNEYFHPNSFEEIGLLLKGATAYYLQCFQDSDTVLERGLTSPTKEALLSYQQIMLPFVPNTQLRGID